MTITIGGFPKSPSIPLQKSLPSSAGTFAGAMAEATSSVKTVSGDRADISAAALALSNGLTTNSPVLDEAYFDKVMRLPERERLAETGKQADAISASQGLPPGKYDFTRMSTGQLMTVRANMVGNLGYSADQLSAMWSIGLQKADGGTSFGTAMDWTTPRNVLGELSRDRDRLVSTNDFANAKIYDASILAIKNASVIDDRNSSFFTRIGG